ncbi:hypothetical protein [Ancylobacter sp. SL191]|uniref:hypothetical protein n=1 Tax=Ancylobacter sp. SL191 TaxID=2995166 RepID=UPI00226F246B|nr:hypothetical protein [Ancylobacter sp. SL191]WAC28401.1 hypothetical protein OU996_04895 [Ancylobacter sp. SL191]
MRHPTLAALAALALLAPGAAFAQAPAAPATSAAPAETTEPVVPDLPPPADCTFTKVYVCDQAGCGPDKELGTVDLPARLLVHYPKRIIASVSDSGLPHISEIITASSAGDNITLQGTDGLVGWVMQLSRSEAGASLTIVSNDKVMTSFGTCKPAP